MLLSLAQTDAIKTADEYYALVSTYDQRRIEAEIARIPLNVNRAGLTYKKRIQQIKKLYGQTT